MVKDSSVVTVKIFDQRKFKRRDQGFLGFVEIRMSNYLDLELGGQSTFSDFRTASPLYLPTNTSLTEVVQLDLKGIDDNPDVQGKLISHLSTIPTMSVTGSRPTDASLALADLPPYDSSRSVNASVDNYSVDNASVNNYSIDNYSIDNCSVNNCSVNNYSVNNYSINNCSVN